MASVKFDSTEILNTTYIPRFVKHESAPEALLSAVEIPREDGIVIVSSRRGAKGIALTGVLVGSSQADLEDKIDAFKELFSREQKQLEISWNAGTRVYTATCRKHEFDRDHFHERYVPWSAEFIVPDGAGYDSSQTTINISEFTTTTPYTGSFTLSGSKAPRPRITLSVSNLDWSRTKGVMFENLDTGEKMIITINGAWQVGDDVIIDCDAKTVQSNVATAQTDVPFYGVFPRFRIGTNNYRITAGNIPIAQNAPTATDPNTALNLDSTNQRIIQSFFVPAEDETFRSVTLLVDKIGTPDNFTITIEEDDGNNKPDGSALATITGGAGVSGTQAYYTWYNSAIFTLSPGVKYWMVIKQTSGTINGSNYWRFWLLANSPYTKGHVAKSTDSGTTYLHYDGISAADNDLGFKINVGEGGETTLMAAVIEYYKTYL